MSPAVFIHPAGSSSNWPAARAGSSLCPEIPDYEPSSLSPEHGSLGHHLGWLQEEVGFSDSGPPEAKMQVRFRLFKTAPFRGVGGAWVWGAAKAGLSGGPPLPALWSFQLIFSGHVLYARCCSRCRNTRWAGRIRPQGPECPTSWCGR